MLILIPNISIYGYKSILFYIMRFYKVYSTQIFNFGMFKFRDMKIVELSLVCECVINNNTFIMK